MLTNKTGIDGLIDDIQKRIDKLSCEAGMPNPRHQSQESHNGIDSQTKDKTENILTTEATRQFILEISDDYANIRLEDLKRPRYFYKQITSSPPMQFGQEGFHPDIVDDYNPARHYTAFVFMGYFFPTLIAIWGLYFWEILGFIRYKGEWSTPDVLSGRIGIRHGRAVRRGGAGVLLGLIERDLRA